jgi:hypothetical protein
MAGTAFNETVDIVNIQQVQYVQDHDNWELESWL